jgi:protein tyrosine kinase modulator
MPLRPDMNPRDYLEIVVQKKWLLIFTFLFVMLGAGIYSVLAPEQFRSSTTILVIPQRVPESYVRSTVSVRIEDRLATLQQQIMSRTRLMAIIEELGLFNTGRKGVSSEMYVSEMQKRIEVEVVRGNDAFTLSFIHEDPRIAMLTASRLASLFIDENLKSREQQAVGTSEFLASQLKETKMKLESQEEKVKRYKLRYMGELPEELQSNLSTLARMQEQVRVLSDGIRSAEDRRVFLGSQISPLEKLYRGVMTDNGSTIPADAGDDPVFALKMELATKQDRIARLSSRYTDRYPELVQLRGEVESLEKRIQEFSNSSAPGTTGGSPAARTAPTRISPEREEIRRLKAQITSTELEIASMRKEREEVRKNIADLQQRVEKAPKREQEIISMTRDYDNLKASYNDLLKKKLEADVSQNLEKRQKGEQFQILDPANLPKVPFKPDRKKILGFAALIACVFGVGGAFGLEMLDQRLKSRKEFLQYFDLPILAVIPVTRAEYTRTTHHRRLAILVGIAAFIIASSSFAILYGSRIRSILNF